VQIGCDAAFGDFHCSRAAQVHVFTDGADGCGDCVGHGFVTAHDGGGGNGFHGAVCCDSGLGNVTHQLLELFVAGNEVGFGVDLDGSGFCTAACDADQPFCGHAAGFLFSFCDTFRAQPIDRGFDVAIVFVQCVLAVHHARAGFLAEFLDH